MGDTNSSMGSYYSYYLCHGNTIMFNNQFFPFSLVLSSLDKSLDYNAGV